MLKKISHLDLTELVNLYTDINKKIETDNHYVSFKIEGDSFVPAIFPEETDYLWSKNKDAAIGFITKNKVSHNILISYENNVIKYSHYFSNDNNLNVNNTPDKDKFNDAFKQELHNGDIKIITMVFYNTLSKDKILACIKIFVVILSLYYQHKRRYRYNN